MPDLPEPLPLPPVSTRRLRGFIATAEDLRLGAADAAAAEALAEALPELLTELLAFRDRKAALAGPVVVPLRALQPEGAA